MLSEFIRKWRGLQKLARTAGWHATLRWAWRRWLNGRPPPGAIDVFAHYRFLAPATVHSPENDQPPNTLNWFIPDFNVGSGGHLNIFRMIWNLEQKGYTSRIIIVRPHQHSTGLDARNEIRQHFFPLQADVFVGLEQVPSAEFAIATGWDTAYAVRNAQSVAHRLYFVQDYEPHFYPVGSESTFAENTYRMGFFGITAGKWLADKLATEYGMHTHPVGFGVEHDRYQPTPRREPHIKRVFFYARPPTPRRAFELGLLVLQAVSELQPGTEFVLAGWDTAAYHIPFPHLACGTVGLNELPDLYSQCDVALVLSLTNVSLLPLELMACGCAVVSNKGANVEWLLGEGVVALADSDPQSMAACISTLLANDGIRRLQTERARQYAASLNWDSVADEFVEGLHAARAVASSSNKGVACAA